METTETKTNHKRNRAPMQLAVRFLKDYKDAITNYSLDQQIEITEHLIGMIILMEENLEENKELFYEVYFKKETQLLKKYGFIAQYFYEKNFGQYFYYETALVNKEIFTEQELNIEFREKPISYFEIEYYHKLLIAPLYENLKKLCLKRKPEFQNDCKVIDINSAKPQVELRWTGNRENSNEFVQLIYGLHKAGRINGGKGEITKIVEELATAFQVKLSKNWQSNHSNSIHRNNSDYKPTIFRDIEDAYGEYVSDLIEEKRMRA